MEAARLWITLLSLLLAAFCLATVHADERCLGVVSSSSPSSQFEVKERDCSREDFHEEEYAYAGWDDRVEEVGWAFLHVHTNRRYPDRLTAAAAGYVEGVLSSERIYQNAVNTNATDMAIPSALSSFLANNSHFMAAKIASVQGFPPGHPDRVYWRHVDLLLQQLQGLTEGYAASHTALSHPLSAERLSFITLSGDMMDLPSDQPPSARAGERGHCSALLKLTDNNADLYVAQAAWSSVNDMLRVYKLYDFPFAIDEGLSLVPAIRSSFSSYPGSIYSSDDFYMLSSGLIVQETTIDFYDSSLSSLITPLSVLEWLRNSLANRLSSSGAQWVEIYAKFNSGTYNNQNMVVDYKLFHPGQRLQNGTFFLCEQTPGMIRSHDLSYLLQEQGYFGSYNTAFDPDIRRVSGTDAQMAAFGSWYDYSETPRAQIFRRNQSAIDSMAKMELMMRYNDFTRDPLSSQLPACRFLNKTDCSPAYSSENAVACRDDLNAPDGVYAFSALGQRNHVAIDAKVSSFSTYNSTTLPSRAVSGPPFDPLPPFVFSTSPYASVPHLGLPDKWTFPWIDVNWR